MSDPIEIKVSPLLALSPHVVYTNIVEAFLRFLLVSKGYVLLHSAALVGEHGATLLSAQTDTGKTSTVISLVRSRGYRFLSDDMTIIDPAGVAISYPKPMTLSFHTMGVAKDGRLTVGDRAKLAIQSRLHSKSGRQVGRSLGEKNLPIMSINSVVQALVPPPKHRIEDLFECAVGGRAPIRNIVLMERGEELLESVPLDAAVDKLLENTDDAYGFPPFALFAPKIRIGGDDYAALRRKEADLLRSAISSAQRWHLRVVGHEWADRLPALIDRPSLVPVGPGFAEPETVPVGPGLPETWDEPIAVGPGLPVSQPGAAAAVAGSPSFALNYMAETIPNDSSGAIN
jgi:dolichol-phosphate mannosyltransferase